MSIVIILTVICTLLVLFSIGCLIYAIMCNQNVKNLRSYASSLEKNNYLIERFSDALDNLCGLSNDGSNGQTPSN